MNEQTQQKPNKSKIKLIRAAAMALAALLALAGVSYAWLYNGLDIETLLGLAPPSKIAILEPDQNQSLATIKLSVENGQKDETGKITFRQPFRVYSVSEPFYLEIAHTTNLKGLSFTIHKASAASNDATGNTIVAYNGKKYDYSSGELTGSYINKGTETSDYKFADNTKHTDVYGTENNVQAHAEPLFWKSEEIAPGTPEGNVWKGEPNALKTGKYYYFVLEASWTEETTKETDLFYILAENLAAAENKDNSQQTSGTGGN